jgi:Flp pilus assembly protein TadG
MPYSRPCRASSFDKAFYTVPEGPLRFAATCCRSLLSRLARDTAGNVMLMLAGMMVLLASFCGCAVDAARLYVVNSRLQQACDAGALAGRRAMIDTSTTNTILDATATAQAQTFFANNFRAGWFGTTNVTFTPSKTSDAQVAAAASVAVPMSVMRMFGLGNVTLTASCSARLDVPDTDVIFVLDTTGSMACLPGDDDTTCNNYVNAAGTTTYSRPLDGATSGNTSVLGYPLSTAYYVPEKSGSRISALRTAVLSFFDTLAAASDSSTHIRYGFVTYTSTVNAGRAIMDLSPRYMVGGVGNANTSWTYNARSLTLNILGIPILYSYQPVSENLTTYVTGLPTLDPTKIGVTSSWAGCIEERYTTPGLSTFNINSLPYDLDPDLVPTSDIRTQWKPMWPEVFYARNNYTSTSNSATLLELGSNNPNIGTPYYMQLGYVSCGKPIARLSTMTRTQVSAYVNAADFRPIGGTYHDTGMIWGTRLLSPTGLFAADTAAWPGRDTPNRVIVFLTDGLMAPSTYIYGMYGNEYYDKRVSGEISAIWPAITTCAFWPNAARPRRATSTSGPFRSPRWRPPR